jgi:hypothetical protein
MQQPTARLPKRWDVTNKHLESFETPSRNVAAGRLTLLSHDRLVDCDADVGAPVSTLSCSCRTSVHPMRRGCAGYSPHTRRDDAVALRTYRWRPRLRRRRSQWWGGLRRSCGAPPLASRAARAASPASSSSRLVRAWSHSAAACRRKMAEGRWPLSAAGAGRTAEYRHRVRPSTPA